jgi:hypothetical protein
MSRPFGPVKSRRFGASAGERPRPEQAIGEANDRSFGILPPLPPGGHPILLFPLLVPPLEARVRSSARLDGPSWLGHHPSLRTGHERRLLRLHEAS